MMLIPLAGLRSRTASLVALESIMHRNPALVSAEVRAALNATACHILGQKTVQHFALTNQALSIIVALDASATALVNESRGGGGGGGGGGSRARGATARPSPAGCDDADEAVAIATISAVIQVVTTPPSFNGQVSIHTILSKALRSITVLWRQLLDRLLPSTTAPSALSRAPATGRAGNGGGGRRGGGGGGGGGGGTLLPSIGPLVIKIGAMISHRLLDQRWELRESILQFLASFMTDVDVDDDAMASSHRRPRSGASGVLDENSATLLRTPGLLQTAWECRSDTEPYVRASLLDLFSVAVTSYDSGLTHFVLNDVCGSEAVFLGNICTMLDDTEAIVRRSSLRLLLRVLNRFVLQDIANGEHPAFVFGDQASTAATTRVPRTLAAESSQAATAASGHGDEAAAAASGALSAAAAASASVSARLLDVESVSFQVAFAPLCAVVQTAAYDLDWEVKLLALAFVAACCTDDDGGSMAMDTTASSTATATTANDARERRRRRKRVCFAMIGGINILQNALVDHDRLVRARSVEICNAIFISSRRTINAGNGKVSSTASVTSTTLHDESLLAFVGSLDLARLENAASDERTTGAPPWSDLVRRKRPKKQHHHDGQHSDDDDDDEESNALGCY